MDGNPIGAGAGAAAGLQDVLLQRFKEAIANKQMQQEQQRIAIEQQRVNNESDLKRMALQQAADEHGAKQQDALAGIGAKLNATLPKGTDVASSPQAISALSAAGMPTQHVDPTLGSRNITGAVDTASTAPKILGLAGTVDPSIGAPSTPNPGHAARELTPGTDAQAEADRHRQFLQSFMSRTDLSPEAKLAIQYEMGTGKNAPGELLKPAGGESEGVFRQNTRNGSVERLQNGQWGTWTGDVPKGAHWMTEAAPEPSENYTVQPVVVNGETQGFIRIGSKSGAVQPVQLPQGMTGGHVNAAVQTKAADRQHALDGLNQLDAAITAAEPFIGPGAGRVSKFEQIVGNPDPKLQALGTKMLMAKMTVDAGIGGARAAASPQLLQRWDSLFSQNLTPASLRATVQAMKEMLGSGPTQNNTSGSTKDPLGIR